MLKDERDQKFGRNGKWVAFLFQREEKEEDDVHVGRIWCGWRMEL